jgi:preprotein translocase subunit SecG
MPPDATDRPSFMTVILLTLHTLIVVALICVVLLQRSEGGALGLGGGGMGGFMTGRGAANVLTRTTSVLAFIFFTTSILMGVFHGRRETDESVIRELTTTGSEAAAPASAVGAPPKTTDELLNSLGSGAPAAPPASPSTSGAPSDDSLLGPTAAPPAEPPSSPAETAPAANPSPSGQQPQP